MRPCFKFTAKAGDKPAMLALDEEIGFWGTQAVDFRAGLDAVQSNALEVEINSPGGDVVAGLGMYNMLRSWAKQEGRTLTTRVNGIAASIASVIALAGDKRQMPSNTMAMMHQVSSSAFGTADELREAAEVTDKFNASLRAIYVDRMGIDEAKAEEIMSKDTWLTAQECLEMGFATELTDAVKATAKFDVERAALPEHVAKVFKAEAEDKPADEPADETTETVENVPATPLAEEVVAKAKAAGLEAHAAFFAVACASMEEATTRIAAAREITALCAVAGRPDDAKTHIRASAKIEDVRAALVKALADSDQHTNQSKPVNQKESDAHRANPGVSTARMWDLHNQRTKKEGR